MKIVPAENLLDQIDGATISSHFIEDNEGLHICFADGRILVIAGTFAISIVKAGSERLH